MIDTWEACQAGSRNGDLTNERNDPGWTAQAGMEEARTHDAVRGDKSVKHLLGDAERKTFHVQVGR